jgi:hypothetical protein
MPTQSERVVNRALSGTELKSYIREAFNKLLDNEGMLSEHIAFGRVGGIIKLTLLLDNAYFPEATSSITVGEQLTSEGKLKDPSSEMEVAQQTATFTMDNPNAERVRLGLPIPVETKQLDGTKQIEHLIYPKDDIEDLPPRQVTIEDTTIKAKKDLGL